MANRELLVRSSHARLSVGAWPLLFALLAMALSGCVSLPTVPERTPSYALAKDDTGKLGKMALDAMAGDPRSGFRLLPEASAAFDTRIELARQAQRTLDVQYYLFQGDDTGRFLMRALRAAAESGVRVRILIDDLYTSGEDPLLNALAAFPNVEIRLFNPFANGRDALWSRFATALTQIGRVNHRMHNKLFIADNAIAIAGGRNIADEYFMRSSSNNFVDIDLLAIGPVVRDLSAIFDRYWNSDFAYPLASVVPPGASQAVLQRQFDELTIYAIAPPADDLAAEAIAQLAAFTSLPDELRAGKIEGVIHANAEAIADPLTKAAGGNLSSIHGTVTERVLQLVDSAQHDVFMVSPYFVPGKRGLANMRAEVARGVDLTVVTNSLASTDEPLVHIGYIRYRQAMLEAGVHIRELSPTLVSERMRLGVFHGSLGALHAKIAIVDHRSVFIGSMNLDERSAFENTELGLIIDSPELADLLYARSDRASSYDLRLGPDGHIRWVAEVNGHEEVFTKEPEAGFWTHLEVDLLGPFVPENQL